MRVAVLSDSHIDQNTHGFDASEAWNAATQWIADHALDCVVVAGDMFNKGISDGIALNRAAEGFRRMTASDIPVLVIAGNHEWIGARQAGTGRCLPIEVFGDYSKVKVLRSPKLVRVPGTDLAVAALPWHEPGGSAEDISAAADKLASAASKHDGPRIAVAHAAVEGVSVKTRRGSEVDLWKFVDEPVVPLGHIDVPDAFGHTALGHIHRRQALSETCGYVGSTEAMTFADEGETKGFSVFEWDDATRAWNEELIPVGVRHFLTLAVDTEDEDALDDQMYDMVEGTLVRLVKSSSVSLDGIARARARVKEHGGIIVPQASFMASAKARKREDGAVDLKTAIEEIEVDESAAHAGMSLLELLDIWFERADTPADDRKSVSDLLTKLSKAS